MPRYVVLHHTGYGEPHYDLMVERDDVGPLATWRLTRWPVQGRIEAVPLPDHRRVYLEFEGPISGGRGEVCRIASGHCTWKRDELVLADGVRLILRQGGADDAGPSRIGG